MQYDIIIVGAGPAGLSTALHLAQYAPDLVERTLVLERAYHPRPKLCAGALVPGGEAWLRNLGLDSAQVSHVDVHDVRFHFEGHGFVVRRHPTFRVFRRDRFDAWLAAAARERGIMLREGTRVSSLRNDGQSMIVETENATYHARIVVGADGANSVVRRAIEGRSRAPQVARLLEVVSPWESDAPFPGSAIIDFTCLAQGVQGYTWSFPTQIEGRPYRTLGVYDSRIRRDLSLPSLLTVLEDMLLENGCRLADVDLHSHPVRWFHPRGLFSAQRVLLVGDAAGVDPLLGEGISFALGYGDVAAVEIIAALARRDYSFSHYRQHVLSHRLGRYLQRRKTVALWAYGFQSRDPLHFLWRTFGAAIGWFSRRFLVDWGT